MGVYTLDCLTNKFVKSNSNKYKVSCKLSASVIILESNLALRKP